MSSQERPDNHPIYAVDIDLGCSIFYNHFHIEKDIPIVYEQKEDNEFAKRQETLKQKQRDEWIWTMYFDGSITKEGVGAGVLIISPNREFKVYSFKLTFECTNNVAEYEAFLVRLNALKELKSNRIDVYGDSKLVINQVNGSY